MYRAVAISIQAKLNTAVETHHVFYMGWACYLCRGGNAAEPSAKHVFMLNCLAAINSVTADQDCCQSKHAALTQDIQHHLRELVNEEASQVLQRCGFKAHLQHNRYTTHARIAYSCTRIRYATVAFYFIAAIMAKCLSYSCGHC